MTDSEFIKLYCKTPISQITNQQELDVEVSRRKIQGRTPEEIEIHNQIEKLRKDHAAINDELAKLREVEGGTRADELLNNIYRNIRENQDRRAGLWLKAWNIEIERFPKYIAELKAKEEQYA
jgi:hypothetical protein